MTTTWVRVMYRPLADPDVDHWLYGWVFASDSLGRAWDTIRKVGDWRKWTYELEMILPNDIDHPDRGGPSRELLYAESEVAR